MDLNIKGVDEELVVKCKARALEARLSLKSWVVEVLKGATYGAKKEKSNRGTVNQDRKEDHSAFKQRGGSVVNADSERDTGEPGSEDQVLPPIDREAVEQVVRHFARKDHVVRECRVYGCGLCKASGMKDAGRGI